MSVLTALRTRGLVGFAALALSAAAVAFAPTACARSLGGGGGGMRGGGGFAGGGGGGMRGGGALAPRVGAGFGGGPAVRAGLGGSAFRGPLGGPGIRGGRFGGRFDRRGRGAFFAGAALGALIGSDYYDYPYDYDYPYAYPYDSGCAQQTVWTGGGWRTISSCDPGYYPAAVVHPVVRHCRVVRRRVWLRQRRVWRTVRVCG